MSIDIKAILYGTVFNIVTSGVASYNASIGSGANVGCQPCPAPLDYRPNISSGRLIAKEATAGTPTYYPQIKLIHTGGTEDKTPTPTFGLMQGKGCDCLIPITRTMDLIITYDHGVQYDNGTTPLEEFIDAAFHQNGYPTFGLNVATPAQPSLNLRFFRFQDRRRDEVDKGGISRTVFRRSMTFDLWPHIAACQ